MIIAIRISGRIKINADVESTLERMNLKRKFSGSLLLENPETAGMIKKTRFFIAYGKITKEMLVKLLEKRGKLIGNKKIGKIQAEKIASELLESKTDKKLRDFGVKPFFRLHPPIKGLKSTKYLFPKGNLGDYGDKINQLLERML